MTVRSVLARLESAGLVSRQIGRGTFVQPKRAARVLLVSDAALAEEVGPTAARVGLASVVTSTDQALLDQLRTVGPTPVVIDVAPGAPRVALVRTVRRQWPDAPVVVVAPRLQALASLQGTPEWPFLVLPRPIRLDVLEQVLRLIAAAAPPAASSADDLHRFLDLVAEPALLIAPSSGEIQARNGLAVEFLGEAASVDIGQRVLAAITSGEAVELSVETLPGRTLGRSVSGGEQCEQC